MTAKEILKQLGKLKSLYGYGARMYMNDNEKAPVFIREIYDQIIHHPESTRDHFGDELIEEIIRFCENN